MASSYVRKPKEDKVVLLGPGSIIVNRTTTELRKILAVEMNQTGQLVFLTEGADPPVYRNKVPSSHKTTRISEKTLRNTWSVRELVRK